MQFASLILIILLALPTLSWAKSESKLKGDCNLNSSCGQPEGNLLNLNDSHTPIPGLANLAGGIKAAQNTQTASATTEAWVSTADTQPLTIAPNPPAYSSEDRESDSNTNGEKAR